FIFFFFSSRRRHTRSYGDWSSDVCSSDLIAYDQSESDDFEVSAGEYAEGLLRPLRGLRVHLLLEPGRAIVGPAGALLTHVLYRKIGRASCRERVLVSVVEGVLK